MLELSFVRGNLGEVRRRLGKRGRLARASLDNFEVFDASYRAARAELNDLQQAKNSLTKQIEVLKRAGQDVGPLVEESKTLNLDEARKREKTAKQALDKLMETVPNLLREGKCLTACRELERERPLRSPDLYFATLLLTGFSVEEIHVAQAELTEEVAREMRNLVIDVDEQMEMLRRDFGAGV